MIRRKTLIKISIVIVGLLLYTTVFFMIYNWRDILLTAQKLPTSNSTYLNYQINIHKSLQNINCSQIKVELHSPICNIKSNIEKFIISSSNNIIILGIEIYVSSIYSISFYYNDDGYPILFYSSKVNCTFNLDDNPSDIYTKLICHGESFEDRWCEATNACRNGTSIIFAFPYTIKFQNPLLNPSARPPPYSRDKFIINSKRIQFQSEIHSEPGPPAIVCSRYSNHMMLWHNLVDFVIPIYRTLSITNSTNDCIIHAFDDDGKYGLFYAKGICKEIIYNESQVYCHKKLIIGVPKSSNSKEARSLFLNYDIPSNELIGLREKMLAAANNTGCAPSNEHPKIFIIKRRMKQVKRNLINSDEVAKAIHEMCLFCKVIQIDLQDYSKLQQVAITCEASLLIGIHGSGLTHALWMAPSTERSPTAMVEILPYMYDCRDWYKKLAGMARVDYISIRTLNINQSRWDPNVSDKRSSGCHKSADMCARGWCHDFLRDQSTIVDIPQFKKQIQPYIDKFKKNRI